MYCLTCFTTKLTKVCCGKFNGLKTWTVNGLYIVSEA